MSLYNRGSSYYSVINVPKMLVHIFKRNQIWHSLKTTNKQVAIIRNNMIESKVQQIFLMEKHKMAIKGFGDNCDDDLNIELALYRKRTEPYEYDSSAIESFALDYCYKNIHADQKTIVKSSEALNYYNRLLKENIEAFQNKNYEGFVYAVDSYINDNQLQPPTDSCRPQFLQSFMLAFIQYLEAIIGYIKGLDVKEPTTLITSPSMQEQYLNYAVGEMTYKKPDLTLNELVNIYNNELSRKNVSQAYKDKVSQRIFVASCLLPHQNIRMITAEELQKFIYDIQWLPLRLTQKEAEKIDLYKVIKKNENCPELCISEKTHFDYIYTLQSLFAWASKRKYLKDNPFDEVDIPAPEMTKESVRYQSFTISQLQTIFNSPLFSKHFDNNPKQRTMQWLIIMALYTGARLNELCQLEFSDLLVDEVDGIKYISINEHNGKKVKTRAGVRFVPIHRQLVKLGFFQFVEMMKGLSKNNRIFADLQYNNRGELSAMPSKWFGRFMTQIGLTEKKLVFHSFRHTVRTELRNNNCPEDRVQRICGWEGEKSLSSHYGTISIKVLADELNEKLRYDGLDLSHLYINK